MYFVCCVSFKQGFKDDAFNEHTEIILVLNGFFLQFRTVCPSGMKIDHLTILFLSIRFLIENEFLGVFND